MIQGLSKTFPGAPGFSGFLLAPIKHHVYEILLTPNLHAVETLFILKLTSYIYQFVSLLEILPP